MPCLCYSACCYQTIKMSEISDAEVLRKLEQIKEIRTKMVQLEKIKNKVKSECAIMDNEDHCLQEYKTEMELLLQEKMAHVEELRLIHADINLMETTIKQAEDERNKALDNARMLFEEQRLLKEQLEVLKNSLGLEPGTLGAGDAENQEENDENIVVKLYEKNKLDYHHHHHHHHHHQLFSSATSTSVINQSEQQGSFLPSGAAAAPGLSLNPLGPPQPHHHHPMHHHHLAQAQKPSDHTRGVGQEGLSSSGMAAFRQQPPPMKACLSCHQQIHRNAPICPLCKAKSRSRNPKKPKRKMEE